MKPKKASDIKTEENKKRINDNYYLQDRYHAGGDKDEIEGKLNLNTDTNSYVYIDNSPESLEKTRNIEILDELVADNFDIVLIVNKIKPSKKLAIDCLDVNVFYNFCLNHCSIHEDLKVLTKIQIFDLVTSYLGLESEDITFFYNSLSTNYKQDLTNELIEMNLIKPTKKLF